MTHTLSKLFTREVICFTIRDSEYNLNRFEIHIKHDMEDIVHSKANVKESDPHVLPQTPLQDPTGNVACRRCSSTAKCVCDRRSQLIFRYDLGLFM